MRRIDKSSTFAVSYNSSNKPGNELKVMGSVWRAYRGGQFVNEKAYYRGVAPCVTTYQALFNGWSQGFATMMCPP